MGLIPKTLYTSVIMACSLGVGAINAQEVKKAEQEQVTEQDERTQQVFKLIQEKNYDCLNCHQVDGKLVGPSYREIAARRKNDKWAYEKLTQVIKSGGSGEYGEGPLMPPHAKAVSDADINTIVDWILSL